MAKVKQQLMHEQEQMEAVEQRWDLVLVVLVLVLVHQPCCYIIHLCLSGFLYIMRTALPLQLVIHLSR